MGGLGRYRLWEAERAQTRTLHVARHPLDMGAGLHTRFTLRMGSSGTPLVLMHRNRCG
jgi:hypothetical protein